MDSSSVYERLIHEMAGGDREAFRALYTATKDAVYGFALSILRSREDAEDVMHDAYIRIYNDAGAYSPHGKPLAWILTIVRNLSLNKIRDAAHTDIIHDDELSEFADHEDTIGKATDRMVLETAMKVLTLEEREIVVLHALTGYRHREIAELLDIPQGTVLSRYNRALGKMKKEISGKGDRND
ncbi:MAG: RNA polymerase sigma factor [Eubacterium sp.]|nr:RNA polymerase sigma factor [Eubacterium sp.]